MQLMMPVLLLALAALAAAQPSDTPQAAVDELLAADRQFAAAGAKLDAVAALSAMFADDVAMMPVPKEGFAHGKAKAVEALKASPAYETSHVEWTPVRGGISADGRHGFTFGYMTLLKPDGSRTPLKYLSYWIRQPAGWRVAVYKRTRGAEVSGPHEPMAPALPARLVPPASDAASIAAFRDSLDRAERAFSEEAQKIGIGPAFAKNGSADAINLGPPTAARVIVGAEAIGRAIGASAPPSGSPVTWAPDRVIVASSGDLGVTLGFLRLNQPPPGGGTPPPIPFITVWRRAGPSEPWRYIAE
jgi:ketosteroid isomerase-like protein